METILEAIQTLVNTIVTWISSFWDTITDFFNDILSFLFNIIGWVFYCIFDGFLAVVFAFIDTLDLSVVAFSMASEWSQMPDQLIWLIVELGIPQCLTVVSGALTLRLLLNILPAALTRI